MSRADFHIVGKAVERPDALEKVTGQARFADDLSFPNQLAAVMVRTPFVHAQVHSVDYSAIESHPALTAICDARDVPAARKIGTVRNDQPVFCDERIVTPGDVVAMLIGPSEDDLLLLRDQIKIEGRPLPVLDDPTRALDEDAPLIHPEFGNNLIAHYPLRKGDVEKGFSRSDFIFEQTYTTQRVEHAYLEPECVTAVPLPGKRGVEIIGSIQNPFTARRLVADVLGWPLNRVRIRQAELGGSFGGKDDIMCMLAARAAIGALKTGRPVKIRYRREESILESYKRHPYILKYKVGCQRDGRIRAMKIDVLADGGAYASMSAFVTWRTVVQATGPYEIENVWTDVRAVYTNNPYTGAMRGFGSPQPVFAQESLMDELAVHLGMTPDEIRRVNGFRKGSVTASGQKLDDHDVNLLAVLDTATSRTDFAAKWDENREQNETAWTPSALIVERKQFIRPEDCWRRGIGLSLSYRGCSLGAEGVDAAAAYLAVQPDGSAYLLCGLAENGQGLRATFSIVAAEILGIPVENIFYLDHDTAHIPDSGSTVASRSTLMGGGAVKNAAEIVRARLEEFLRREWSLPKEAEFVFTAGRVQAKTARQRTWAFRDLCALAYKQGINLAALGWYAGPRVHWDERLGQGPAYFTYVYGCQVAEVRVNIVTGEVRVERVTAVHDPGTVINLLGARGQVYGGVTQGAGYALWEEITSPGGRIRELNFDEYIIPTSKDIGCIEPVFVEGRDSHGPWGAKSLGEPTLELTSAAIANAVCNATGKRLRHLPLNLEEVLLERKLRPEDVIGGAP
jgi:CO/xanthine dehydrogenase Mo-binding subunit